MRRVDDYEFRVWDVINDEMVYFSLGEIDNEFVHGYYYGNYVENKGRKIYLTAEGGQNNPELEVMQYTGLRDKNGIKIFEGDIVKGHYYICGDEKRLIGKVRFRHNMWIVDGVKQYNRVEEGLTSVYEIIGNIYDNPELLGVEQCVT